MSNNWTIENATSRRAALIGQIYESVIEAARWPALVAQVIEEIGGVAGWIAVHRPDRIRSTYQIEVGTDPHWQALLRDSYVPLSPYIGAAHYVRSGDILSVEDVADYDEFTQGRFYREWAAPQGWPDLLFAVLSREADAFSFLGVCLPRQAVPAHKEVAASLVPHLERALRILDMLDRKSRQIDDLEAAVGTMATGVALSDADGRLLGLNGSAEKLLGPLAEASPPGIRSLRYSPVTAGIHRGIRASAIGAMPREGETLLINVAEGQLTVHIVPLPSPKGGNGKGAVAALFVTDPARPPALPPSAIMQRFGLTPSELRVALALTEGRSPAAIAAEHGISLATVRSHLRRLYDKTGTDGQATLVRTVLTTLQGV